ncbi:hypothetical protein TRIUR3_01108 [Triticum urartu]|uniref:Uncharacterized protein n=1 Tax=Triticum urartu TaxID=4572 RepID=M7ZPT2_TRIUA|nr:hypothetical protein TRIUR3_01108 [Triticum urartu]
MATAVASGRGAVSDMASMESWTSDPVDGTASDTGANYTLARYGTVEEGEDQETVVAEVRRKVDEGAHVVLGRDVFVLWVRAGFDAAFAMGIVLVLGRITGDELDGVLGEELLLEATSPV